MLTTVHGSALGFAGGVVVTALFASWPVFALLLLVVVVVVVSWWTTVTGAVLTAVQCWGLYASFVVGHEGRLVADWPALAVLAVAGTASLSGLARSRAAAPSPARSRVHRVPESTAFPSPQWSHLLRRPGTRG